MGTDLPLDELDYSYAPRPPDPLAPAIDRHMWEMALLRPCSNRTFCGIDLTFCPLSLFHDCIEPLPLDSSVFLPKIPQKHSEWLLKTPETDYAWGIQTKEEPYFILLVCYHLLIFAGPFVFWAWWLSYEHAQTGIWDLQNASVPATIVGVLLSLFWSVAHPLRILDSQRLK
jgi:hypothetical protein